MQNWNDGKTQEFHDRKTYNARIALTKEPCPVMSESYQAPEPVAVKAAPAASAGTEVAAAVASEGEPELVLFTTKTCPNCKMAKFFLDKAGFKYSVVLAEDAKDEVVQLGVKQTPTLVIKTGDKAEKVVNVSNIRKFTETGSC